MAGDLTKKSEANHQNAELSIYSMVLNRMPILSDTPENQQLISNFILEIMHVMNKCFGLGETEIGVESEYSVIQQSIIADLTCLQILIVAAMEATGGNATDGTEAINTFLKKAKAGSVEVEFGPFSLKDNATLAMSGDTMFNFFKRNAINKASQIGCLIDVCDDCSIKFLTDDYIAKPFMVVGDCGCNGGTGETIPERNLKFLY